VSSLRGWLYAPAIALQFLTRIPVNGIPDEAYDDWGGRRASLVFFPLVGAVVGAIGAAAFVAVRWLHMPDLVAAVGAVAATAATTGCFHEDGFADTADGLGPHSREAALRAMRDSRIGTFGSLALWALLTVKAVALSHLPAGKIWAVMISAHIAARWSPLPLSRFLPYIQETSGLGAGVAQLISLRELLPATLILCAAVVIAWRGESCAVLGVVAGLTALAGLFFRRRFGGVTGDCLGAANQIVEAAVFLAATRLISA
jgi:adenosylcobinamide-GDP ribazoletransferase